MSLSVLIKRVKVYPPIYKIRQWFTPERRRLFWRVITFGSLVLVIFGAIYALQEIPKAEIEVNPLFLGVAFAVYALSYVMHLFGWHSLATLTFGHLPFRDNVEAVAASDLVKYLPTVAWYIANRVHFYDQRQIKKGAVVAASLLEMVALLGTGIVLYFVFWLNKIDSWLVVLIVILILAVIPKFIGPKVMNWWHTRITSHQIVRGKQPQHWINAIFWYGISWFAGGLILATTLRTFVPINVNDYIPLLNMWLLAGLFGTIVSLSVGTIGIAREATLTFMLAQYWPLPASIATAVSIKLILMFGQVVCALIILGLLRLIKRKNNE